MNRRLDLQNFEVPLARQVWKGLRVTVILGLRRSLEIEVKGDLCPSTGLSSESFFFFAGFSGMKLLKNLQSNPSQMEQVWYLFAFGSYLDLSFC